MNHSYAKQQLMNLTKIMLSERSPTDNFKNQAKINCRWVGLKDAC